MQDGSRGSGRVKDGSAAQGSSSPTRSSPTLSPAMNISTKQPMLSKCQPLPTFQSILSTASTQPLPLPTGSPVNAHLGSCSFLLSGEFGGAPVAVNLNGQLVCARLDGHACAVKALREQHTLAAQAVVSACIRIQKQ